MDPPLIVPSKVLESQPWRLPSQESDAVLGASGDEEGHQGEWQEHQDLLRPDTPALPKNVYSLNPDSPLDQVRQAYLEDIGTEVKELDLEFFLEDFVPALDPEINIRDIVYRLKKGSPAQLKKHGWSAFPEDTEPRWQTGHEDEVYRPFKEVVHAIIDTKPITRESLLDFGQWPTKAPLHKFHRNDGKPDGVAFVPLYNGDAKLDQGGRINWNQIVVPAQYKKSDTKAEKHNDNVLQIFGDMAQILCDDPMHRFVYGITIENYTLRAWYCDRSEIVVSKPFNFMTEYIWLIRFVLAIAYAPSLWDIGFDTTMTRSSESGQYEIRVHDGDCNERIFRTTEIIQDYQAYALRGRATRVWKAVELVDGKPHGGSVVLKDTWIEPDRTREGLIPEKVLTDVQNEGQREFLKDRFLTVVCHGDVLDPDGLPDMTRMAMDLDTHNLKVYPRVQKRRHSGTYTQQTPSRSFRDMNYREAVDKPRIQISYDLKIHYRVVFKEVGLPLKDVKSLRSIFRALSEIAVALGIIHKAGWVHRDISVTNIIMVGGQVKLTDLEYAKKKNDHQYHALRTATDFFAAVEVKTQKYRHKADASEIPTRVNQTSDALESPLSLAAQVVSAPSASSSTITPSADKRKPAFRCNALHDLESLWWLAVYFLFYREIKPNGSLSVRSPGDVSLQRQHAMKLFESDDGRKDAFSVPDMFCSYTSCLHPSVRDAAAVLEALRIFLIKNYVAAEAQLAALTSVGPELLSTIAIDSTVYGEFYLQFSTIMRDTPTDFLVEPLPRESKMHNKITIGPKNTAASIMYRLQNTKLRAPSVTPSIGLRAPSVTPSIEGRSTVSEEDPTPPLKRRRNI